MLVEIEIGELPANVALAQNCTTGAQAFVITGNVVDGVWPVQGYLEITAPPTVDTSQREVVKYDGVAPNAFTNIVRGIVGDPVAWDTAAIVSAVVPLSKGSLGVVEAAAQANMYRFWVGHRAQYDRYFALPGIQELDLPSLLTLIRSQEDAADRKYKRLHKAIPPVGTVRRKGRRR